MIQITEMNFRYLDVLMQGLLADNYTFNLGPISGLTAKRIDVYFTDRTPFGDSVSLVVALPIAYSILADADVAREEIKSKLALTASICLKGEDNK